MVSFGFKVFIAMDADSEKNQNSELGLLKWPTMHESIKYINKGLYATEDI